MRCNPLRWLLLGLLLVPAMTFLAVQFRYQHIQDDLHDRSQQALKRAGLPWGGTAYVGRDGLLSGRALEEDDRRRAQKIVNKIWGVYRLDNSTNLIDKEDNYVWSAVLKKNRIKLSGFVPNEASRRSIVSVAKVNFPERKIKDHMRYARGVPSRDIWMGGISFSLQQLARLKNGRAILSGLELTLSGDARDFAGYRSVKSSLAKGLPRNVKLRREQVRPPTVADYKWRAIFKGKQLVLSGHVPSEAIRERIFVSAKKRFPKVVIVDRMETALGQPENWVAAVDLGLSQLAQLNSGAVLLNERTMKFSGIAETELLARALDKKLGRGMPRNFRATRKIKFIRPAIKLVKPFTTSILLDADLVILDGYVPSNGARLKLTNAMKSRYKGHGLIDKTEIAAVAPKHWKKCMLIGVDGLGRLGNGQLKLTDRKLLIVGSTRDEGVANSLAGDVRATSGRSCESDVRIDYIAPPEPNLVWSAKWTDGTIILDGEVPDADSKTQLVRSARKLYPKADVLDRMKVVGGYAKNWRKVALSGLRMLASLRQGYAKLDAQKLTVNGEARDTSSASAIHARLQRDLPKGYGGRDRITVRSDAMIWAAKEAKRKAALAEKRKIEAARQAALAKEQQRLQEIQRRQKEADERARAAQAKRRAAEVRRKAREERLRADEARRREQELIRAQKDQQNQARAEMRRAEEATRRREEEIRRRAQKRDARRLAAQRARQDLEQAARRRAALTATRLAAVEARRIANEEARAREAAAQSRRAEQEARRAEQEARRARLRAQEEERRRRVARLERGQNQRIEREARRIACEGSIRDVAKRGVIRFRRGRADLNKASFPTLDRLAEAALVCSELSIEIEGHTDSDGTAARNKTLSQRRANSVRNYLVSAGVPSKRLKAIGFGEERPLVKNNSKKNKARNRRIEFNVRVN